MVQRVFLVGAKSLGRYGGYETFIDKLTEYHQNNMEIQYYVACKKNGCGAMNPSEVKDAIITSDDSFIYHNSKCFQISVPEKLGPAQAIFYDCAALKRSIKIIQKEKISNPIIYIMACRIGLFMRFYSRRIKKMGGRIFVNPDGHEWLRKKWSLAIRKYWKWSEKKMVGYSDLVICDSKNIEKYVNENYKGKNTTYIAYGAETKCVSSTSSKKIFNEWIAKHNLCEHEYYLIVGRFVPENNYETIIREFLMSSSRKKLVIITNINDKFEQQLEKKLNFKSDDRIKFAGTVYNQELLTEIRMNAFAYIHGHEVGGTNPSLLEALATTNVNLLCNVSFNCEVAEEAAIYWEKSEGSLSTIINQADKMSTKEINQYGENAKKRIEERYSWSKICNEYLEEFLK